LTDVIWEAISVDASIDLEFEAFAQTDEGAECDDDLGDISHFLLAMLVEALVVGVVDHESVERDGERAEVGAHLERRARVVEAQDAEPLRPWARPGGRAVDADVVDAHGQQLAGEERAVEAAEEGVPLHVGVHGDHVLLLLEQVATNVVHARARQDAQADDHKAKCWGQANGEEEFGQFCPFLEYISIEFEFRFLPLECCDVTMIQSLLKLTFDD